MATRFKSFLWAAFGILLAWSFWDLQLPFGLVASTLLQFPCLLLWAESTFFAVADFWLKIASLYFSLMRLSTHLVNEGDATLITLSLSCYLFDSFSLLFDAYCASGVACFAHLQSLLKRYKKSLSYSNHTMTKQAIHKDNEETNAFVLSNASLVGIASQDLTLMHKLITY